jgi:hypothetical protein
MNIANVFLDPQNTTHRQYEALRAYFVDKRPGPEVAHQFGYTLGSLHQLIHQFRQDPKRLFFLESARPGRGAKTDDTRDTIRQSMVALRKQNMSIYEISAALQKEGIARSPVSVAAVLDQEGFAKLPRRTDEERERLGVLDSARPIVAAHADVRALNLEPRSFRTQFGGLFLFLPALVDLDFDHIIKRCGFPGTPMIPAPHALRSLLALKLFGTQRHLHVMSAVLDEGLALFAGLNVIPKRSYLTEYSCRIEPACYPKLMQHWFDAMLSLGLQHGTSFDLDFHTIPFHGEDALVQKHYISKRSRSQKGILAFLAQDADHRFFCYANTDVRKVDQNDEVLAFIEFWKKRTGQLPKELIFDSKLTTYANLDWLNQHDIEFITLRRRGSALLHELQSRPRSAWRQVEIKGVSRLYKTPRILDGRISLPDYTGPIRQIAISGLGHEELTLLLTNQLRRSAPLLIERYAQRMLIENNIEDGVHFFHIDALSSAVALKVNCDVQLTLMASSLYRHVAQRIGHGYESAKSQHVFRDFIEATAQIDIDEQTITIHFQRRAHNPLLLAAGFHNTDVFVPWLGRQLRLSFG